MLSSPQRWIQILISFAVIGLLNTACQPAPFDRKQYAYKDPGTTGYLGPKQIPYTIGGDKRVPEHVIQIAPKNPEQPTVKEANDLDFAKSLVKVQMIRFDEKNQPARFGLSRVKWFFWFETSLHKIEKIEFEWTGAANASLSITGLKSSSHPQYSLQGALEDSKQQDVVNGAFNIYFDSVPGQKPLHLLTFLRSYIADVSWRTKDDEAHTWDNQNLRDQLKAVSSDTYAWVTNWTTVLGRATYDVQILKLKNPGTLSSEGHIAQVPLEKREADDSESAFQFTGEALRTSEVEGHTAQEIIKGQVPTPVEVKLSGDTENSDERLFEVSFKDESTGKVGEALLIVAGPQIEPSLPSVQNPNVPTEPIQPAPKIPRPLPKPEQPEEPAPSTPPAPVVESNNPRIQLFAQHLEQNIGLKSVRKFLDFWAQKTTKAPSNAKSLAQIQNFVANISPLKILINKVFEAYNVLPNLVSIWLSESNYFSSDKFSGAIVNPDSTATGPGQILRGTGVSLGMRVDRSQADGAIPSENDERRYLAPSLCGTALHVGREMDRFEHDLTWTIVAYHEGGGGAEKIHERAVRSAKTQSLLDFSNGYKMSYADAEKFKKISGELQIYVGQILAGYFVATDAERVGVTIPHLKTKIPEGIQMLPPKPINDTKCMKVVAEVLRQMN